MKRSIHFVFLLLVLACGKKPPVITSPADGHTLSLTPGNYFDVMLETYEQYEGTTIEFRGIGTELAKELSCQNAANGPARCAVIFNPQAVNQFSGGFNQQTSWTIVVIVKSAQYSDVRTVNVVRPNYQTGFNNQIFPNTAPTSGLE